MEKTEFTLGYLKKRIFLALGIYGDGEVIASGTRAEEIRAGIAGAIHSALTELSKNASIIENAPIIDDDTSDNLILSMDRCAFEALVCLAASRLCSETEASLYTRLLYKYKDLCEGLFEIKKSVKARNGFYGAVKKRGEL